MLNILFYIVIFMNILSIIIKAAIIIAAGKTSERIKNLIGVILNIIIIYLLYAIR